MGAKASYDSAIGDVEQRLEPSQSRINNTLWKCLAISSLTLNVLLLTEYTMDSTKTVANVSRLKLCEENLCIFAIA